MKKVKLGIEAATKYVENEQIMIFLSYCLIDAETWYSNSEYECLVVIKCLNGVKWLVINNPCKIFIYLDHYTLQDNFLKNDSEKAMINAWLVWFSEFNIQQVY